MLETLAFHKFPLVSYTTMRLATPESEWILLYFLIKVGGCINVHCGFILVVKLTIEMKRQRLFLIAMDLQKVLQLGVLK